MSTAHMPLLERLRKGANCVGFLDGAPEPAADAADIMRKAAYAIEFGGYLAKAARRYMASVNREIIPEGDTECSEAWRGLESAIYEFEKRS